MPKKKKVKKFKLKTHKGGSKRFKITGKGNIKHKQSHRSHILTKKTSKRKRQLRDTATVHHSDVGRVKNMLVNNNNLG